MPKVTLKGWTPGLQKVSVVKLLQVQADLSLTSAKRCVDGLLAGEEFVVTVATPEEAAQLAEEIRKLGVVCEIDRGDEITNHSLGS
jgi:ribosomal protein L7/L12